MKTSLKDTSPLWHAIPNEAVFSHLTAAPAGLTKAEADLRMTEYGPNELQAAHRISP